MHVLEVDFTIDQDTIQGGWGDEILSPQPRSPGVHVSHIIRYMESRAKLKGYKPYDLLTPEERRIMGNYREMGFMWEWMVEQIMRSRMLARRTNKNLVKQQELCLDNIYGTIDGFDLDDWCLEEFKATYQTAKKANNLEVFFLSWMWQIKAYLKMLDALFARLFVWFVVGNYKGSGPQARMFELTFTQFEVDENWAMLLTNRDDMIKQGLVAH